MDTLENILKKYRVEIKEIYFNYFYSIEDFPSFQSYCYLSDVIKILNKNKKLLNFLDKIDYCNEPSSSYSIQSLTQYKCLIQLDENYFHPLNIFILLLQKFEKEEFFFNGYKNNEININMKLLIDLYMNKKYSLKEEKEFNSYNLIEINENREMWSFQSNRIIDKLYKITFDVALINKKVFKKIETLYKETQFKISFYPDCLSLRNKIDRSSMTFDAMEFGKQYSYNDLEEKKIKLNLNGKFIDFEKKDALYIRVQKNEITFEEIQDDLKLLNDEIIFTKVIHLEFEKENGNLYINHIDLEYIFYSLDEYANKFTTNNFKLKGNTIPRQKIFKIDDAKIDLIRNLYTFVYFSFDNKNLIDEYFDMLNN